MIPSVLCPKKKVYHDLLNLDSKARSDGLIIALRAAVNTGVGRSTFAAALFY